MDGFPSAARPVFPEQESPTGQTRNMANSKEEGVQLTGATVCHGKICFSIKLILYLAATKLVWADQSQTNNLLS